MFGGSMHSRKINRLPLPWTFWCFCSRGSSQCSSPSCGCLRCPRVPSRSRCQCWCQQVDCPLPTLESLLWYVYRRLIKSQFLSNLHKKWVVYRMALLFCSITSLNLWPRHWLDLSGTLCVVKFVMFLLTLQNLLTKGGKNNLDEGLCEIRSHF